MFISVFTDALFLAELKWSQPTHLSIDKWTKKM